MERRKFLKSIFFTLTATALSASKTAEFFARAFDFTALKRKIQSIIYSLKQEGSNIVKKALNGRKYIRNPFVHYPFKPAIKDKKTGCAFYFHAHRKNEYGHFHTFIYDDNGALIHLVLISMNKKGEPTGLATVNRWVTGDKYAPAKVLKEKLDKFFVSPELFKEPRLIKFVNLVMKAYREEIFELFEERDKWINDYARKYYREPFEDRRYEVLSYRKIKTL